TVRRCGDRQEDAGPGVRLSAGVDRPAFDAGGGDGGELAVAIDEGDDAAGSSLRIDRSHVTDAVRQVLRECGSGDEEKTDRGSHAWFLSPKRGEGSTGFTASVC